MKKMLFMAAAVSAIFAMTSCGGQKAAPVEEEAAVLADSIKTQASELFAAIQAGNKALVESVQTLDDAHKAVPAKFFMPVEAAANAQTLEQKSALLGCYLVDAKCEQTVYGVEPSAERNAVVAQLAAEVGLGSDEAESLSLENLSVEAFESALEADNADCLVNALVYAVVEATLNNQAVFETQNGYVDDMAVYEMNVANLPLLENVVKLIKLLAPHYESLGALEPLVEKVEAVLTAEEGDAQVAAVLQYNSFIRETRGKLNVAVDAD